MIIDRFSPCVTFEGDNTVMLQQSANYLLKLAKKVRKGEPVDGIFYYLNHLTKIKKLKRRVNSFEDLKDLEKITHLLKSLSLFKIDQTTKLINRSNSSKDEKNNSLFANDIIEMSQIHLKSISLAISIEKLKSIKDKNLRKHVTNCIALVGLTYIKEYASIGFDRSYIKPYTLVWLNQAIKDLLVAIRPQFIPLLEIHPFSDNTLMSAVGNSYGDIYETHLEWAMGSRMN